MRAVTSSVCRAGREIRAALGSGRCLQQETSRGQIRIGPYAVLHVAEPDSHNTDHELYLHKVCALRHMHAKALKVKGLGGE